jgi:hypothetical protein
MDENESLCCSWQWHCAGFGPNSLVHKSGAQVVVGTNAGCGDARGVTQMAGGVPIPGLSVRKTFFPPAFIPVVEGDTQLVHWVVGNTRAPELRDY